jgi:3',5'-cyclic AMP phosphodiesterase CpdA
VLGYELAVFFWRKENSGSKMTDPKIQEMPPEKLRFLHFSDVYFGQEKNGAWVHDDIRREVLNDCQKCLNDGAIQGPPNAVIITGDVAYAGKEAEFKRAVDWLDQLLKFTRQGKRPSAIQED